MPPRIGDLALLSDCSTAALVERGGAVVWWPGRRFDGPSVFSRLLDEDAGHFEVAPAQGSQATRRNYLDGTLVLRTEHDTPTGLLRVLDALVLETGARGHEIGMRSPDALVRVLEAEGGDVRETVLREAWSDPRGALAGTIGGDELDAAVLLAPVFGFLPPGDERMLATTQAIEDALGDDGLIRRFEGCEEQGAFLPATFWLAACHAMAGQVDRARACMERAAACATDLGLFSEMADPRTGKELGNFPQALSHVAVVAAATAIEEAEGRAAGDRMATAGSHG